MPKVTSTNRFTFLRSLSKYFPYLTDDYINARFKGDVIVDGLLTVQNNSVNVGGGLEIGGSNETLLLDTFDRTNQYTFSLSRKDNGISTVPRYPDSYEFWDKNSTTGQFQPNQTTTLDFVENPNFNPDAPTDPETGYRYTFPIVIQAQGDLQVTNWYLRSATGFDNYYVVLYKGFVTDPVAENAEELWKSHTAKEIREGNCFNASADVVSDITFPLGNSYYQVDEQLYTFIGYAQNQAQFEAGDLVIPPNPPITYPYVLADGYFVYQSFLEGDLTVGTTENVEGNQNMNDGQGWGILKKYKQGDFNYSDFLLIQNGLNNANQSAQARIGIYNVSTDLLITQGVLELDNTFGDRELIRLYHTAISQVEDGTAIYMCVVVNEYTSGGIVSFARTRSQNVNEQEILFNFRLNSGDFPADINSLTNISNASNAINSNSSFDITQIVPLDQPIVKVP